MAVTAHDLERVPARNLRIPRAQFGAVWAATARRGNVQTEEGGGDWYVAGVSVTCMWLAGATYVPPWGRPYPARSPATDRELQAYPESIEAEFVAAQLLAERRPRLAKQRPGWSEGICATLRWAWRAEGPPPLDVARLPAGLPAARTA